MEEDTAMTNIPQCLICLCKIQENEEESPSSYPLEVIFLLRKVLGVPVSLLAKFRRGCPRVEGWISVCEQCKALVRECRQIYEQLCQLTRKWSEGQAKVRGLVRDVKLEEEEDTQVQVLDIGREIRNYVRSDDEMEVGSDQVFVFVPGEMEDDLKYVLEQLTPAAAAPPPPPEDDVDYEESASDYEPDSDEDEDDESSESEIKIKVPWKPAAGPHIIITPEDPLKTAEDHFTTPDQTPNFSGRRLPPILPLISVQLCCPVPGCGVTFANANNKTPLSCHKIRDHTKEQVASIPLKGRLPSIYECRHCLMRYTTPRSALDHVHAHHPPGTPDKPPDIVHCLVPGCSVVCPSTLVLKNHQRLSHTPAERDAIPKDGRPYECPTCGQRFRKQACLAGHEKGHGERAPQPPVICDVCGALVKNVQTHKKLNLSCQRLRGEVKPPQKCPSCDKTFHNPSSLRDHIREVHENRKATPLQCATCGQTLKTSRSLSVHMATVHGQGDFPCAEPNCGKVFFGKKELEFHVDFRHRGVGGHKCEEPGCGKRWKTKRLLKNHVNQKHLKGEPGYKCAECGKAFYFGSYLHQHKRLVHQGVRYHYKRKKNKKTAS